MPRDFDLFVDCGAPSLYNRLSRDKKTGGKGVMGSRFKDRRHDDYSYVETQEYEDYLCGYVAFIKKHRGIIDTYSNLDVINNPVLTRKNQRRLESMGISPIPVFHLGNNLKHLDRYVKNYDYIALGGLVPNTTRELIPILDRLFNEHLVDDDGFPKVKVHGFACTSHPLMSRYPWYSVDSTTARKIAAYGGMMMPVHRSSGGTMGGPTLFTISTRQTGEGLQGVGSGHQKMIEKRAEEMGINITPEELSTSGIARTVWNYLVCTWQLYHDLPPWPWSIKTGKAKAGADGRMRFYLAGSIEKEGEYRLWDTAERSTFAHARLRSRLISYFYSPQAEFIINVKKGERT